MSTKGILYLVATPIGNLEDMTLRAIRILKEVDIIAAEDTRQTLKLLNYFSIKNSLTSYYEHNKVEKGNYLIEQLLAGKSVAVVSDAGTPGISDPGEDIVRLAIENGISVTMVPGSSAFIMGLVISGLPTGRFVFEGFLPVNKRLRKKQIQALKNEIRTIIFYEAPHKLLNTLNDLLEILGDRKIALTRELTKKFEEIVRLTISEAIEKYSVAPPKGEFVLIVEGVNEEEMQEEKRQLWNELDLHEHINMYINQGMSKKDAIKKVAEDRGVSKRYIYNEAIKKDFDL